MKVLKIGLVVYKAYSYVNRELLGKKHCVMVSPVNLSAIKIGESIMQERHCHPARPKIGWWPFLTESRVMRNAVPPSISFNLKIIL